MPLEALLKYMEIRSIPWEQTIPLRHKVLWPNKTPEFCQVDGDEEGLHFGAFINNQLICVASVYLKLDKARLRKFATDPCFQNQGVGSKMLEFIIHFLKSTKEKIFWCDARESALGFYERFEMYTIFLTELRD
ncbi:MAG: ribosomal protein S18 acetylase RimI-like enzyme [Oleiphilaceae bacterium]|jgi:ribosomal protein S18 acetylase RimI-like enzyme